MHLLNPRESDRSSERTLESTFSAKYPWLLRWALHFAQNDRATAEDLVQETFIRILIIRDTLSNLDDIEPLLYTHLRFAYLTERRRARSRAFQSLAIVDFDTLAISLRTSSSFDRIELQNELRNVLTFLLWRRRSAKFASMFLLRFFHSFSPEEIASICLVTRNSVDLGLRRTREELKAYLVSPTQIQVIGRGLAPDHQPFNLAVPSHEFANALMAVVFSSPFGECPSSGELERRYQTLHQRALENDLVAHIVTCRRCLDKVTQLCGAPPPSSRSMGDALGPNRRPPKSKKPGTSEKDIVARIIAQSPERMREIFGHRPFGLAIALNTEIVAERDISSPSAVLKVETRSVQTLELVEIFSEQGLLMLAFPLSQHPPQAPPELRHEIMLSGDRRLSLVIRFTGEGAMIEATYLDPHFTPYEAEEQSLALSHVDGGELDTDALHGMALHDLDVRAELSMEANKNQEDRHSRWQGWWHRIISITPPLLRNNFIVPVAVCVILVLAASWMMLKHEQEQLSARTLIHLTARSEAALRRANGPGVIHQQIEIRTAGRTVRREIYRDIEGRRRPKESLLDKDDTLLRSKLAESDLNWDDPLSAAGFEAWHDRVVHEADKREADKLDKFDKLDKSKADRLTIIATTQAGPVLMESLTVRQSDLHPVARSIAFRDGETIEIAELSFEVIPWGPEMERWFEPAAGASSSTPPPIPRFLPTRPHPSEAETDIAQLAVLLALQELHADTERLEISRNVSGIVVKGVVESDARKHEINSRLTTIPHVDPQVLSYRDFDDRQVGPQSTDGVKAMSVTSEQSPLDIFCESRRVARDRCQHLASLLLSSSSTLVRESRRLSDLQRQYPSAKTLTPVARALLDELTHRYVERVAAATREQQVIFPLLDETIQPETNTAPSQMVNLNDAAQHNLLLAKELVYAGDAQSRTASSILQNLAASLAEMRAALTRAPSVSASGAELPSSPLTPRQN